VNFLISYQLVKLKGQCDKILVFQLAKNLFKSGTFGVVVADKVGFGKGYVLPFIHIEVEVKDAAGGDVVSGNGRKDVVEMGEAGVMTKAEHMACGFGQGVDHAEPVVDAGVIKPAVVVDGVGGVANFSGNGFRSFHGTIRRTGDQQVRAHATGSKAFSHHGSTVAASFIERALMIPEGGVIPGGFGVANNGDTSHNVVIGVGEVGLGSPVLQILFGGVESWGRQNLNSISKDGYHCGCRVHRC